MITYVLYAWIFYVNNTLYAPEHPQVFGEFSSKEACEAASVELERTGREALDAANKAVAKKHQRQIFVSHACVQR